jgi:predicted kinase
MSEVVLLIGMPGAGKTTFFEQDFAKTHRLVSMDVLRNHRHPATRQLDLLREALDAGVAVVVDNTNASRRERAAIIALARSRRAHVVGYFFECAVHDCVARNAKRAGRARVPNVAIFATAKRLEQPDLSEGFDALYVVRPLPGKSFDVSFALSKAQ